VALMMSAIARHDPRDPFALPDDDVGYLAACDESLGAPVRIAWSADLGFASVEQETRETAETAARAFAEIGVTVEEANPDLGDPPGLDALLPVQLQRPAGRHRPGRLDDNRLASRVADRRPAPGGRAGAQRRGGIRGAPPVGDSTAEPVVAARD